MKDTCEFSVDVQRLIILHENTVTQQMSIKLWPWDATVNGTESEICQDLLHEQILSMFDNSK